MSAESAVRDGNPAGFDLIETMRWEPATGFVRFDRHLARLYASARELGFGYDPERIGETLKNAIGRPGIAAARASRPVGGWRRDGLHAALRAAAAEQGLEFADRPHPP